METLHEKESEVAKSERVAVKVEFFYAKTNKPDEFVDELEQLCKRYCDRDDFFFKYSLEK